MGKNEDLEVHKMWNEIVPSILPWWHFCCSKVWGLRFACDKAALFRARTSAKTGVKRTRLRCTKLHKIVHLYHPLLRVCSHVFPIIPMLYSGKLFEFACPMHCWTSNRSSSKRLPLQHSASPSFMGETHDVASKFPMLISAIFSPCFYVTCLNHFSHALVPDVQNFVPRIPPTNRAWSSNHASDHTSKVDIEFDHIGTMNAPGPSSKTSDWCHDGIEEFQFLFLMENISAQKNWLVGKEGSTRRL